MIRSSIPQTHLDFFRNCTPGFYNNEGDLEDIHRLGANNYFGGSVAFYDKLHAWREDGTLAGLDVT
jgi:cyclohexanone monooxygenase